MPQNQYHSAKTHEFGLKMSMIGPQIPTGSKPQPCSSSTPVVSSTSTAPSSAESSNMAVHNKAIAMMARGMIKEVAKILAEVLFDEKCDLKPSDVNDELEEVIRVLPQHFGIHICEQLMKINYVGVKDVSAYLISIISHWRDRVRQQGEMIAMTGKLVGGPPSSATKMLLDSFDMNVTSTERVYGPPPKWPEGTQKPICEVRVSQIAPCTYEDELVPYFGLHGDLYSIRIMLDPTTGVSNGFAHVTYVQEEKAKSAVIAVRIRDLRGLRYLQLLGESFKGQTIKVSITLSNCRLFIGNVPKTKTKEELMGELIRINIQGAKNVICYPDHHDPSVVNRGFFFCDFIDHESAASAKKILESGAVTLFNSFRLFIDWAEGHEASSQDDLRDVKVAFLRCLPPMVDHAYLNKIFSPFGRLEKINRMKDFAFVHFINKEECLAAIAALRNSEHFDQKLHVELARPQNQTNKLKVNAWRIKSGSDVVNRFSGVAPGLMGALQWQQDQSRRMEQSGFQHPAASHHNPLYHGEQNTQQQWQQAQQQYQYMYGQGGHAQPQGYGGPQPPPPPPQNKKRSALEYGVNAKRPRE